MTKNKIIYQEFGQINNTNNSEHTTPELSPAQQNLKISISKAGRKGKIVTIITGFQCSGDTLVNLLKELKTKLGAGGTIKDNTIELQGDRRQQIGEILLKLTYKVKII